MRHPRCHPVLAVLFGLIATFSVSAADEPRPKIGLVLGGGGARGGAHVGVLRVLEELRVPVDYLAGTSMGSLVGALYCEGYSPDEIERIVRAIPWDKAFRDAPDRRLQSFRQKEDENLALLPFELGAGRKGISGRSGIITGTRIDFIFRTLTLEVSSNQHFDRLRIPYRAIATDLKNGEMVVLDQGDLADAMRASMSVPGVFTPVEIDGRVLVDGGLARNIPVDVVRSMGAERVIAIDVGTLLRQEVRDLTAVGVLSQTSAAMGARNRAESRAQIGPGDLLITPELGQFSAADFERIEEAIALGEVAARAQEAELRRYSVSEAEYAEFLRRQRRPSGAEAIRVDSIAIEGIRKVPVGLVRRRIKTRPGEPLNLPTLSSDLDRVWQLGDFETVEYRIDRDTAGNRLVIEAREKPWGPGYLRFGLSVNSTFGGETEVRALAEFRRANINRFGAEWKTVVAVGNPFEAVTEFYQPLGPGRPWFVAPRLTWSRIGTAAFLENGSYEGIKYREATQGVDLGLQLRSYGEIRLGVLRGRVRFDPVTTTTFPSDDRVIGGARLKVAIDRLDDTFFPTQGNRTILEAFVSRGGLGADDDYDKLQIRTLQARTFGRNTILVGVDLGTDLGSKLPFDDQYPLGGFLRLSGFDRGELRGNVRALFTLADYWRVAKLGALGKFYVGAALQAGNVWASGGDAAIGDLIYSGTFFVGLNTKFSPVFLGFGLAEEGNRAQYFLVGRAF